MCGISVIVHKNNDKVSESMMRQMNNAVIHRGPDGEGYYFNQNLAMGHRRLKIIDLSNAASQPMDYNGIVITYNGEIYNFPELRIILSNEGYTFHTHSDTEVILAAYRKWGKSCVSHFYGMWAFVIYDEKQKLLFCSRDRFGIKPLSYFDSNDYFSVASEIKQFTAIPAFVPKLNHQAAFNFLFHGNINGEEKSFFKGIKFLLPGQNLIYDITTHSYEIETWYSLKCNNKPLDISYSEATIHFRELFDKSIRMHMRSDVEVGACLSGGLDSSSIIYSYKNQFGELPPLKTISTCFEKKEVNEIEYIDYVTSHTGFPGNKIYPDIRDILKNNLFEKICYHQDQPITGGSFFSEYKVFEKAGQLGLKVMLDGQGADEYLGGYEEFYQIYLNQFLHKLKLYSFTRVVNDIARYKDQQPFNYLKQFGYNIFLNTGKSAMRKLNIDYFAPIWMNKKMFEEHSYLQNPYPILLPGGIRDINKLSKKALTQYSLPHQLHSEDRHSMMHSVESRLPFLDHSLVEFVLQLPDNFKIRKGVSKSILRCGLDDILPEKISQRNTKLGFPGPERDLFLEPDSMVRKILLELVDMFPEIFSMNLLEKYNQCFSDNTENQSLIFKSLAFYFWARKFNVRY